MVIIQSKHTTIMLHCQHQTVIKEVKGVDNYYPRLKDLREDHDLSQQKVADYLGMKQSQYSRYERGLRDVPTDVLIQLARLYNTTTDYILGLTNKSSPAAK